MSIMSLLDAVRVLQRLLIEQETLGEITIIPLTYPRGKFDAQASYFLQASQFLEISTLSRDTANTGC